MSEKGLSLNESWNKSRNDFGRQIRESGRYERIVKEDGFR